VRLSHPLAPELERIIRKCLQKERERRYQSSREIVIDLENVTRSLSVGADPPARVRRSRRSRSVIDSLAVLPLVNDSGDPKAEYLSDGITESITSNLSQLPTLRVMAFSAVRRYKGKDVDPQTIGRELGVRAVLTGRVLPLGDRFVIGTELVDVADGSQLWGAQYNRALPDIFEAQEDIAREVSDKLRLRLSRAQRKLLAKRYTIDPEAYTLYLKGNHYCGKWTEAGWKQGIAYFTQAVARDPNYGLAYAALANTYIKLGLFGVTPQRESYAKARAAAMKALEIDGGLAEAHTSAGVVMHFYDWDWAGAGRELRRAIDINPNYAEAHFMLSYHLTHMGQFDEAFAEIAYAQELDPLSVLYIVGAADIHKDARQYDRAIELCQKALELDAGYGEAFFFSGQAYEYQGRHDRAIADYRRAQALLGDTPELIASLGHAYAVSGKRDEARKRLGELLELSRVRCVDSALIAAVYGALGEHDEAFRWIEQAFEDRSGVLVHAKVEPIFDDLRQDARFPRVLQRLGFAASS
jgi:TolB-like protein/Flp pilus assembly protein TadD